MGIRRGCGDKTKERGIWGYRGEKGDSCSPPGMAEWWNSGIMGKKVPLIQYSNIPFFTVIHFLLSGLVFYLPISSYPLIPLFFGFSTLG
jgi:hypothetical protein